ncbi:MAG: hypothetical protein WDW38_004207 [Sanguina aurantia]
MAAAPVAVGAIASSLDEEDDNGIVSRHASNKITYKLSQLAEERCHGLIESFNLCAKGRSFSMVWACKSKYTASNECVHKYVCAENIDVVCKRWVDLGRPRKPDWSVLLEGMDDGIES